jgi:hypothetical protein
MPPRGQRDWLELTALAAAPAALMLATAGTAVVPGGQRVAWGDGDFTNHLIAVATSPSLLPWAQPMAGLILATMAGLLLVGRRIQLVPAGRLPAIILTLAAVAMPSMISGVSFMDIRLPVFLSLVLVAASRLQVTVREGGILAVIFMAALGVLFGVTGVEWRACGQETAALIEAVPPNWRGSRLLPVRSGWPGWDYRPDSCRRGHAFDHWSSLLVLERSVANPMTFTLTPLQLRPDFRPSEMAWTAVPSKYLDASDGHWWQGWRYHFDNILWMHFGRPYQPPAGVRVIYRGASADLLEIQGEPLEAP